MKILFLALLCLVTPLFLTGTEIDQNSITEIQYSHQLLLNKNSVDQPLIARSGGRAGGGSFSRGGGGGGSYSGR